MAPGSPWRGIGRARAVTSADPTSTAARCDRHRRLVRDRPLMRKLASRGDAVVVVYVRAREGRERRRTASPTRGGFGGRALAVGAPGAHGSGCSCLTRTDRHTGRSREGVLALASSGETQQPRPPPERSSKADRLERRRAHAAHADSPPPDAPGNTPAVIGCCSPTSAPPAHPPPHPPGAINPPAPAPARPARPTRHGRSPAAGVKCAADPARRQSPKYSAISRSADSLESEPWTRLRRTSSA